MLALASTACDFARVVEYLSLRGRVYLILSAAFVTALLVADCIGGKFFQLGRFEVSVGTIPFPITFILTDIINEYYGRRGARFATLVGMLMLVFGYVIIAIAGALPIAPNSIVSQTTFDSVFGLSLRFFSASLIAYVVGQLTDIYLFSLYKRLTNSRHLWLRATGSTVVSQIIDTTVVNLASLVGLRAMGDVINIIVWSYLYKIAFAVVLTPVIYLAHTIITDRLGVAPAALDD